MALDRRPSRVWGGTFYIGKIWPLGESSERKSVGGLVHGVSRIGWTLYQGVVREWPRSALPSDEGIQMVAAYPLLRQTETTTCPTIKWG